MSDDSPTSPHSPGMSNSAPSFAAESPATSAEPNNNSTGTSTNGTNTNNVSSTSTSKSTPSNPAPTSSTATSTNPRSCITCRRRKVKCDKRHPCSNCVRARIECIFPGPGRAPRKSRKPGDAELLERLRKLEGVVRGLNQQVEEHEAEAAEREREGRGSIGSVAGEVGAAGEKGHGGDGCPSAARERKSGNGKDGASVAVDDSVEGLETRFGRLVVENGRSRYVNNRFWASLNNEVEDLKAILVEPSDDEDVHSPDSSNMTSQHQGFIFGYSSTSVDMLSLHPAPERARDFWTVYKENVDLLVRVLHVPTFEPVFFDAITHPEKIGRGFEALLFAIYYGAATSTTAEDCLARWGEDRSTLLSRYRFGLEQALARANFLYCDELVVLQAFVIFLILLRRNDDARKIWTLTGLAVRIAQTLGVHRDGSHFRLPPFEIEMRRRLWWQVCILDARSSEDHGCDPTIVEAQFDTKMPLNLNDTDISPDMKEFPPEREGFTEMTFCLLRFEVANIFRRILYIPPGPNRCNNFFASLTIPEKEKWITDCHERMEERYLKHCDMSIPLCWVTATISRLIMSKMWLIVYHPHQRKDGGATLPQETKDKLFITSLENIEYSILLETEARTMKWGWLFRTYIQWHAVAYLLSELCVRTKGEAVERAWRALEATAGRWWFPLNDSSPSGRGQQGCLWKPLKKLLAKAKAARDRELALERAALAIRNGSVVYADVPQRLGYMNFTPTKRSSSTNLDRLLRSSAPKMGEIGTPDLSSWPDSAPPLPLSSSALAKNNSQGNGSLPNGNLSNGNGNGSGGMQGPQNSLTPAEHFSTIFDYGTFDLVQDIMADEDTGSGMYVDSNDFSLGLEGQSEPTARGMEDAVQHPASAPLSPSFLGNRTNGASKLSNTNSEPLFPFPTTSPFSQPSSAFLDLSPVDTTNTAISGTTGTNNGNGTVKNAPEPNLFDGGSMDWTAWNDLVNQYGEDGGAGSAENGVGNLGLVHWF